MKYIASFSGGKDSAAMLLLILEKKLPLDEIVFIDTGVEFDEIYNIIDDFEKRINFKITRIKAEKNFEEYFYTANKRGKRKGQIRGFLYTLGAWCNSSLNVLLLINISIRLENTSDISELPLMNLTDIKDWEKTV